MSDVIVAGGGVIGLSIAWELASQGAKVRLLEQGSVGREASWAGAGMLPPGNLAGEKTAEGRLRALSHDLWPGWAETLQKRTGIHTGYFNCGSIELSFKSSLAAEVEAWERTGTPVESLARTLLHSCEPAVNSEVEDAYRLPTFCQVRNPRHLKALQAACQDSGVEVMEGTPVCGWKEQGGRITAAMTSSGEFVADRFVIAAGAWSSRLLSEAGVRFEIEPVRGQIALLKCRRLPFRHVLQVGSRYLVPRPDGRILIGSTEEKVGFVKQTTVAGLAGLLKFAERVVPALRSAAVERTWSGLRPHPGREVPLIGLLPGHDNVIVAAGHFRSGLQMSPGTALLVRQLILQQESSIPLQPYSPGSIERSDRRTDTEPQAGSRTALAAD